MKKEWIAPEGQIWVCTACGKTAPIRSGGEGATWAWDASCFLNAILVDKSKIVYDDSGTYVIEVKE